MGPKLRRRAIQGLVSGETFTLTRTFSRQETHEFGDLTRDYNPVHYDRRWTDAKGFGDLICHGLLVGGMICEFGGQVGWLASGMTFRFIKPVYVTDTVECQIRLISLDDAGRAEAEGAFFNQHGDQVAWASLKGRLPNAREQQILADITAEGDLTNGLA
jgi:acyl dehydratase